MKRPARVVTTTVTLPMSPEFIAAVEESKARVAALPQMDADLKAKYLEAIDRAILDGGTEPGSHAPFGVDDSNDIEAFHRGEESHE